MTKSNIRIGSFIITGAGSTLFAFGGKYTSIQLCGAVAVCGAAVPCYSIKKCRADPTQQKV